MDPKNAPPVEEYDNLDIPASPPSTPPQAPVTPYVVPQQEVPMPITPAQGQPASPPPVPPSNDIPPVYEDNGKKRMLIAGGILLFFVMVIIGGVAAFIFSRGSAPQQAQNQVPAASQSATLSNEPRLLPKVAFDSWTKDFTASQSADSAYVLTLQQPSEETGREFARKLGFGDIEFGDLSLTGTLETASESALFMYEVENGALFYLAETGKELRGEQPEESVVDFLQRFGIYDSSMNVFATYQKTTTPGVTYYELHRDWDFLGFPIVTDIGLTALPESQALSRLTQENQASTPDETVTNTSDNTDGFARAEDFNTITVGVEDTSQRVVYIYANMRLIDSVQRDIPIISADEAFELLQNGSYEQLIPVPAGEGDPGFGEVFPGDVTRGAEAVITDAIPAYVEKPFTESQEVIQPYWVFRGYSELESGYRVRFIATVRAELTAQPDTSSEPAEEDAQGESNSSQPETTVQSALQNLLGTVFAGETRYRAQQQQDNIPTNQPDPTGQLEELEPLDDADPTTAPQETPVSASIAPTTAAEPTTALAPVAAADCRVSVNDIQNQTVINGFTFGQGPSTGIKDDPNQTREWYYIPDASSVDSVAFAKQIFDIALSLPGEAGDREQKWALAEILAAIRASKQNGSQPCPARVTGISPTLFYYGTQPIFIQPLTSVTYADPSLETGWTVIPTNQGLLVNSQLRPYLYYEYNPRSISIPRPEEGWILSRVAIPRFVADITKSMQLTDAESERLLFEIMDTARWVDRDYLRVSLISRSIVDQNIPLSVQSSQPLGVERIFFHIEGADLLDERVEPIVTPIPRSQEMVLEIGGYTSMR